jgi:hypothetical protein
MYDAVRPNLPDDGERHGIGTPKQLRDHLAKFAEVGVDQVVFIQQGGNNRHEDICSSLELFAQGVMPEFKANEDERERRKLERLAPALEAAMARKQRLAPLADSEIPVFPAYGRTVFESGAAPVPEDARMRERRERMQAMAKAMEKTQREAR